MGKYIKDGFSLFDFQLDACRKLVSRRRAILLDSVGNGKTMQCLYSYAYLLSRGVLNLAVVFTPKNAYDKRIWATDAARHTHLKCISLDDVISKVSGGVSLQQLVSSYDVIYAKHTHVKTSYAVLRELYLLQDTKILTILDELHAFKTPSIALTKTMKLLLSGTYALWGLTATILSKSCMDTYNIINFVYPKYFPSYRGFQEEFCRVEQKVVGKKPDGSLRRVTMVIDYKDTNALQEYCSSILVTGVESVDINVHVVEYTMGPTEESLYTMIAKGLLSGDVSMSDEAWLAAVLSGSVDAVGSVKSVKDLERHSSRFIYLQSVVNGALGSEGTFGLYGSAKVDRLVDLCREFASRGESALIYCETYTSVDVLLHFLRAAKIVDCRGEVVNVSEQSARRVDVVTEGMCSRRSQFVILTKAKTESANWTFINNAVVFDVPTVPSTVIQFVGRIQRRSSKYLGNLHVWYFRNDDISEYKLRLTGSKVYFQEGIAFKVNCIPRGYIKAVPSAHQLRMAKQYLLWGGRNKSAGRGSSSKKVESATSVASSDAAEGDKSMGSLF